MLLILPSKIIKAQPSNYGNRVPGLDMQWHSKLRWNIQEIFFWRKCKLELSLPCANPYEQSQLQPKSLYCNQPWKNSITYAKYMWKICVRIGMCYLCTIHIIDAYSSTTKKNASPSTFIGGLYIGGLGEGRSSKKNASFPWPPLPLREAIYIYVYTLCLFFLLPFPWGSSWLSGHSLATSEEVWQSVWVSSDTITGIWT